MKANSSGLRAMDVSFDVCGPRAILRGMSNPEDNDDLLKGVLDGVEDQRASRPEANLASVDELMALEQALSEAPSQRLLHRVRERVAKGLDLELKYVLIVEDSSVIRGALKRVYADLENRIVIDEVETIADALDLIREMKAYDLISLDFHLQGGHGMELLRSLKAMENPSPVMVVSTENERDDITEALMLGARSYLTKPFTKKALEEHVRPFLEAERDFDFA